MVVLSKFHIKFQKMRLSILDANLWLLPKPLAVDQKKRLMNFINIVKKFKPDIITCQEVWMNNYVRFLEKNLSDYKLFTSNASVLFNSSGLVTLSRVEADFSDAESFEKNKHYSFFERIASKGYLVIRVLLGKYDVWIVNTHLYNSVKESDKYIAKSQFFTLKKVVKNGINILLGDIDMNLPVLESLNKKFFYIDTCHENTYVSSNKYANLLFNKYLDKNRKVDYVLIHSRPVGVTEVKSTVIKEPLVSDHFPLFYEFFI